MRFLPLKTIVNLPTILATSFIATTASVSMADSNDDSGEETFYRFPREQRDLELKEVSRNLSMGVQAEASAYRERHSDTREKDSSIDGLDLEFLYEITEQISIQVLVNYEFDGSKRILFEEVFAQFDLLKDG